MTMQLRTTHRQSQTLRPLTTAHLAQTMTLLSLNLHELQQKIDSALAENPALELLEERRCPTCNRILPLNGPCAYCSYGPNNSDEPVVFISPPERSFTANRQRNEDSLDELYPAEQEDLPTFVMKQIAPELSLEERAIAAHLLSSLDNDGFLTTTLAEVARYFHIPIENVERVVNLIQQADPIGVGATSAQNALLIQAASLGNHVPYPELTFRAIQDAMDLLSKHHYNELAKRLATTQNIARTIANFISDNLNPYPARTYWGNIRHPTTSIINRYHQPDVIIRQQNSHSPTQLVVEVLWPISGVLQINSLFKQAIEDAPPEKSEQWRNALEQASLLIKCLAQRGHTLVRLMRQLTIIQKEFIIKGEAYLVPITRAQLAQELQVHESTISRAVAGKSVQLPSGQIIPISQFFDRSLHIRSTIKEIIEQEKSPLSDTKIAKILSEQQIFIARRTVAKYRAMEGILPAHLRHTTITDK